MTHLSRRRLLAFLAATGVMGVAGGRYAAATGENYYNGELVISGTTRITGSWTVDSLTVPAGAVLEFDPDATVTLQSRGNVVVEGELRMGHGPGRHTLRFIDVDETAFVGGGMDVLATDVGLWVMGAGVLNIEGVPRAGWNRTGTDPTWLAGDEIRSAPNGPAVKNNWKTFPTFTPGSAVPKATFRGVDYRTEVFNLTRSVVIEGQGDGSKLSAASHRAHVFIHSTTPQTIRYATFQHLAPRKAGTPTVGVLGRYGLHFHHCEDGSRGSLVEGVVVRDCGGHAFVPHGSHGITMRDCVSFNTFDGAYWWDADHRTNDILWDHCAAFNVQSDPTDAGRVAGFLLGLGQGMQARDCAAAGVNGGYTSSGFEWPEFANFEPDNVWTTSGLVAHNTAGNGVFAWQNDDNAHELPGLLCYRNYRDGIEAGAYANGYHYTDLTCFGNGTSFAQTDSGDLRVKALPNFRIPDGGHQLNFDGVNVSSLVLGPHNVNTTLPLHLYRVVCDKVVIAEGTEGRGGNVFIHADLDRSQVFVSKKYSTVTIVRSDGTSFVV